MGGKRQEKEMWTNQRLRKKKFVFETNFFLTRRWWWCLSVGGWSLGGWMVGGWD
jgi:hypothetical protein